MWWVPGENEVVVPPHEAWVSTKVTSAAASAAALIPALSATKLLGLAQSPYGPVAVQYASTMICMPAGAAARSPLITEVTLDCTVERDIAQPLVSKKSLPPTVSTACV